MGIEGEGLVFVVYSDAIATMPGDNIFILTLKITLKVRFKYNVLPS